MFKYILSVMIMATASAVSAQAVTYTYGKNVEKWISPSGSTDIHIGFKNVSGSSAEIVYAKVAVDFPAKWEVSFCDDLNCYLNFVDRDTFLPIANNASTELKITVFPYGFADTAVISYYLYAASNPSVRDTFTLTVNVPWGVGTSSASVPSATIYPNPVTNNLAITSLSAGTAQIVDMKGAVVKQLNLQKGLNSVDFSAMSSGVYSIVMSTTSGVTTQKIIKN